MESSKSSVQSMDRVMCDVQSSESWGGDTSLVTKADAVIRESNGVRDSRLSDK